MPKQGEIGARLVNGDVVLMFEWVDDRFRQVFTFGERRLVSIEEGGGEGRLAVYAEVHQQGDVVFASGAGDGCHWSASVSLDGDGFLFDVAARVAQQGPGLASCYNGAGWLIEATETDGSSPVIGSAGSADENRRVQGADGPFDLPATVRYRYRVSATP